MKGRSSTEAKKRRAKRYTAAPTRSVMQRGVAPSEVDLRACLAKLAWDTAWRARRFAADKGYVEQRPYQCACGLWHLTAQVEE